VSETRSVCPTEIRRLLHIIVLHSRIVVHLDRYTLPVVRYGRPKSIYMVRNLFNGSPKSSLRCRTALSNNSCILLAELHPLRSRRNIPTRYLTSSTRTRRGLYVTAMLSRIARATPSLHPTSHLHRDMKFTYPLSTLLNGNPKSSPSHRTGLLSDLCIFIATSHLSPVTGYLSLG
jgi:hypothetical protein